MSGMDRRSVEATLPQQTRRAFVLGSASVALGGCCPGKLRPSAAAAPAPGSPAPEPRACAPGAPEPPPPESTEPGVRWAGRVEQLGPASARYAWSGSGFTLRFAGSGVSLTLSDGDNLHSVLLDGKLGLPLRAKGEQQRVLVTSGLPLGEHTLEVYRRTEALFGPTTLHGVEVLDGALLAPPGALPRHVEVVGDSISCGYGNEGANAACSFSPETQNHYLSYGAIAARSLNASVSTVAWSGRGVVRNYAGEVGELMPALYERTLPAESSSRFGFTQRADAVLVNLGTNDFSTEPDPHHDEFARAYERLLTTIRERNPSAFVLCLVGPMLSGADAERALSGVETAVNARVRRGDAQVALLRHATENAAPGCDYHPSVATHHALAREVVTALREYLCW